MKKALIPFLVAGMLSATSCTETFEPSVDYGDQTYINDYSALVSAVNDLNKSVAERFEALNTLLNKNMADLKLAIDENTGAIKVQGDNMENGLSAINTTLLNGFSALSTQIDATGTKIVTAMDKNGELLRLEIDEAGKLISAQIETSANKLAATINSLTASLEEKLDALTLITKNGLADISVKIDAVDKTLDLQLGNVNTNLGKLNDTMFDGFKALNTTITATGGQIITAMNENGELLRLEIDETGKLISAQIETSTDELKNALIKAINDQTTTVAGKFDALNDLITAGFANVTAEIGRVGDQLHLDIQGVNTNLGNLHTAMTEGFTLLGTKIDANGATIAEAIDAQGNKLEIAINGNGEVISSAITDFTKEYKTQEEAELAKMAAIITAINALTTTENTNSANLIEALNKLLKDNGVYYNPEDKQAMYMLPGNLAAIKANKDLEKIYSEKIEAYAPKFVAVQVTNEAGFKAAGETERPGNNTVGTNAHGHATFTALTSEDKFILVGKEVITDNSIADGREVVKVIKTALSCHYNVFISNGSCSYPNIYKIKLMDARAESHYVNSNGTIVADFEMNNAKTALKIDFELNVYDEATGKVADTITAFAYCSNTAVN